MYPSIGSIAGQTNLSFSGFFPFDFEPTGLVLQVVPPMALWTVTPKVAAVSGRLLSVTISGSKFQDSVKCHIGNQTIVPDYVSISKIVCSINNLPSIPQEIPIELSVNGLDTTSSGMKIQLIPTFRLDSFFPQHGPEDGAPPHQPGRCKIRVSTNGVNASPSFLMFQKATITGFHPLRGSATGGTKVPLRKHCGRRCQGH
ncbi:hypothetical protein Ae201684P_006262 [Aphanomyces euteiches]|nr:hypothetical protein Ae201684P_006262 [Aphanomyces euteiches]